MLLSKDSAANGWVMVEVRGWALIGWVWVVWNFRGERGLDLELFYLATKKASCL